MRNPDRPIHKPVFPCPKCKGQREHDMKITKKEVRHLPGFGPVPHVTIREYYCVECMTLNYRQQEGKPREAV